MLCSNLVKRLLQSATVNCWMKKFRKKGREQGKEIEKSSYSTITLGYMLLPQLRTPFWNLSVLPHLACSPQALLLLIFIYFDQCRITAPVRMRLKYENESMILSHLLFFNREIHLLPEKWFKVISKRKVLWLNIKQKLCLRNPFLFYSFEKNLFFFFSFLLRKYNQMTFCLTWN